jgi:hypothetical protein
MSVRLVQERMCEMPEGELWPDGKLTIVSDGDVFSWFEIRETRCKIKRVLGDDPVERSMAVPVALGDFEALSANGI